jgi:hypothetical protein
VWTSDDGGGSWSGVVVAPTQPNVFEIAVDAGLAYLLGADVIRVPAAPPFAVDSAFGPFGLITSVAIDDAGVVYEGTSTQVLGGSAAPARIRKSIDSGVSWDDASSGLGDAQLVGQMVAAPGRAGTIYAVAGPVGMTAEVNVSIPSWDTMPGRVLRTRSGGACWTDVTGALPARVRALAVGRARIYAGTLDGTVYTAAAEP